MGGKDNIEANCRCNPTCHCSKEPHNQNYLNDQQPKTKREDHSDKGAEIASRFEEVIPEASKTGNPTSRDAKQDDKQEGKAQEGQQQHGKQEDKTPVQKEGHTEVEKQQHQQDIIKGQQTSKQESPVKQVDKQQASNSENVKQEAPKDHTICTVKSEQDEQTIRKLKNQHLDKAGSTVAPNGSGKDTMEQPYQQICSKCCPIHCGEASLVQSKGYDEALDSQADRQEPDEEDEEEEEEEDTEDGTIGDEEPIYDDEEEQSQARRQSRSRLQQPRRRATPVRQPRGSVARNRRKSQQRPVTGRSRSRSGSPRGRGANRSSRRRSARGSRRTDKRRGRSNSR